MNTEARGMELRYKIGTLLCVSALLGGEAGHALAAQPAGPSTAFYYGRALPAAALSQFDRVVVQADQADAEGLALLRRRGSAVFAYVSLSEVGRIEAKALDVRWRLGENPDWETVIMDAAQPEFRKWLLDTRFQPLWGRGYRAFFLDNLDSYLRATKDAAARTAQARGLAQIIKDLHARFPGVQLLFNRGFELLPEVAPLAAGLAAESLFRGWDPVKQTYVEVSESDRRWLVNELRTARDRYHLPIIAIDYVPLAQRELARATAARIAALGMTPWVTEASLSTVGIGAIEAVPRRILALYNGAEQRDRGEFIDVAYTPVHRMAAVVLEHLGYAIDYVDVRGALPAGPLGDRYAGIVTWFTDDRVPNPTAYRTWLMSQIESGVKVAILDHLGFSPEPQWERKLGLSRAERSVSSDVKLVVRNPEMTGFEASAAPRRNLFQPLRIEGENVRRLLSVEDNRGQRMDAVFTSWWGGLSSYPYLLEEGHDYSYRWITNPFAFLKQALRLPELPAPDVTTQDGRRMLIVHIDGDGFVSRAAMPGNDYCGKVIRDQILKRYPVKATVSIIEGEIGAAGKWPKLSPELESIARSIFALPNVEVASHSYSHPFDWLRFGQDQEDGDVNGMFRYDFSLRREVQGSVDYINRRLSTPEKPVKVYLWSGEAIAPIAALAEVQNAGLLSMNGGNTIISSRNPTLTTVSPMGRPVGGYYQVYAPVQNENVFTNLWRGPFYGFRDVISTFKLTESPRRLKPINIYFHFYSGSKIGSLKVLKQIFDWASAQDVVSVYGSDYIRKVEDFQTLSLGRRLDGCWQLRGDGALTTLRIDSGSELGAVDSGRSSGVRSVRELAQGRYVSLDDSGRAVVCMEPAHRARAASVR